MSGKTFVYVSSWTHRDGIPGLGLYEFNNDTGELTFIKMLNTDIAFSVSTVDHKRNILYVIDESANLPELRFGGGGRIFAYKLNPENGDAQLLCCTPTYSTMPSFVSLDPSGRFMVVSNHASRSYVTKLVKDVYGKYQPHIVLDDSMVQLFSVHEDGSIGEILDVAYHVGDGPNPRQTNAHPHSARMSPSGKLFAVCDSGSDFVRFYKIDAEHKQLLLTGNNYRASAGTMPRSCAFHPTKPFFYYNMEGRMDMCAMRYDEDGSLTPIGDYNTLPEHFEPDPGKTMEQQEMVMHPNGEYLYDVLNGAQMVAVFKVDQGTGALTLIQNQEVDGEWPRGCAISPNGKFLVLACKNSGRVFSFSIGRDGTLTPTGFAVEQSQASIPTFYQP